MKKLVLYTLLLFFGLANAQKMGYVDTQYILKQMPQYQQAEQRLNAEVQRWKDEIKNQQSKLEKMRVSFENEKVLLTEEQQKTKLAAIDSTEKNLNEFIDKKFGTNGESTNLRYNLAKPVQDQIWNAINAVAAKDKYNFIFDKSSDLIMVFTDSKYDLTDRVLKQLGGTVTNEKDKSKPGNTKDTRSTRSTEPSAPSTTEPDTAEPKVTTDTKPKSGYGSKYVPKKETKKTESQPVESKPAETQKSEGVKSTETKPASDTQPKSGYGSKYVPKKETKKTESQPVESKPAETQKSEGVKSTETKSASTESKPAADTTKPKSGYGSKYVPKKEEKKPEAQQQTTDSKSAEAKPTTDSKPKSGYGSKYVPKKETKKTDTSTEQNNNIK